jgi:RHH-type rel operon transcriptional repressor/antitoxin RelB
MSDTPMATLNLRIADDMKQQLDALAEATGRNKSFLAVEAIRAYLQQEAWQVAEIRQAIQEADAGDFADTTEVQAVRDKWLDDAG